MKLLARNIFLIFLFFPQISFAQTFVTKVSATTIGKNDVLQVEYESDNVSMDQFVLPRFDKWTVISGPNLSSSTIQTGNIIKQQMVYSLVVQPNATGTLTVPGATALINNKPQKSNSITVKVKNVNHITGSQPPKQAPQTSIFDQFPFEDEVPATQYLKKGERAIDKIKNNILVRLEVNKHECYVGEPILATYKLCTRLRSKSKVVKQPQFSGCTVVELTGEEQDQHVEKINGIPYNVFVIRKVQLTPLAAGKLVLPQTSVENKVSFYEAGSLSYRDLYYSPPKVPLEEQFLTLQNKPQIIDVMALPPVPSVGNIDFSGAVGNFDATVAVKENNITTSTTNHLLFTIEGEGNLQPVKAPEIKWPKGVETFETIEQNDDDKSGFPVKSKKTYSFPFIVNKKGVYKFPAIAFTYFNADANRYVTKATRAFTLSVAQGKKKFFLAAKNSEGLEEFQERLYFVLGASIVAVLIGLLWYNGKRQPQVKIAAVAAPKEVEVFRENKKEELLHYVYAIRELQPAHDSSAFYKQLSKNIESYLQARFGVSGAQLAFYIEQHHEHSEELEQLKQLMDNCSLGMYTPVFTIEQAMQHRLKAIEVLSKLEDSK